MGLRVRASKHLVYTQAELDAAYLRCAEESRARDEENVRREKLSERERWELLLKEIEEAPLVPSYGREPERHRKIVQHAATGQLWIKGFGYMDEVVWEDILKWNAESAAS